MRSIASIVWLAIILVLALVVGPLCVNFILAHTLHAHVSWGWGVLISFFSGDSVIPLAIIVNILLIIGILN